MQKIGKVEGITLARGPNNVRRPRTAPPRVTVAVLVSWAMWKTGVQPPVAAVNGTVASNGYSQDGPTGSESLFSRVSTVALCAFCVLLIRVGVMPSLWFGVVARHSIHPSLRLPK